MYHKWMQVAKLNEKLLREKEDQAKKMKALEGELAESKRIQGDLSGELEHLKKTVKMLNSGSTNLDQILTIGKTAGNHMGLGYMGESSNSKTVFVPAAKVEKTEVNQRKTGTQTGAQAVTPSKKWIPVCHYCERSGHIRPRCFQYLADLRKISESKQHGRKITRKAWRRKGDQSNVPANVPVDTAENDPENVLEDVSNKEEGCCVLIPQSDYTVRYSSCRCSAGCPYFTKVPLITLSLNLTICIIDG